ncbi:unnamed protein product [Lactuca saligna]|uniref:Uncharacterized protein n=1 Tax=Lactuca saligna TaxID=75948 RepID=A0AA36ELC5_LACSI|nr:unnamed protein product [Lactuca saligna]
MMQTWNGHTKGVLAIRFLLDNNHMLLLGGMDTKVKIWENFNSDKYEELMEVDVIDPMKMVISYWEYVAETSLISDLVEQVSGTYVGIGIADHGKAQGKTKRSPRGVWMLHHFYPP